MTESTTTAIVKRGHLVPERKVGEQTAILPSPMVTTADRWLQQKRDELARAEAAVPALRTLGAKPARIRRVRERIRFLKRFVGALEHGYVPIPRFDSQDLDVDVDELPAEALVAMANAKALRLFDQVRFVPGRRAESRPGPHLVETTRGRTWTRGRLAARDPLVVGIIRTPEHQVRDPSVSWPRLIVVPAREEHFLIAFWRPEDEQDWTML